MKLYLNKNGKYDDSKYYVNAPFNLSSEINRLILAHLILYIIYLLIKYLVFTGYTISGQSIAYLVEHSLSLSSKPEVLPKAVSWISLFSFQFIHFNAGELLLSMFLFWLFGHILSMELGERKVILLYFIFTILSGVVFLLSHQLFQILSGPRGIMEGAITGVLAIMTITVTLNSSHHLYIGKDQRISLWHVYLCACLLAFMLVYKHNISFIITYLFSIFGGLHYGNMILNGKEITESNKLPANSNRNILKA
ncbi:MAG TPA: rhomboid family intramembrane serine protease [Cytophagaceae bacterium]